jgi:hypothetical protein
MRRPKRTCAHTRLTGVQTASPRRPRPDGVPNNDPVHRIAFLDALWTRPSGVPEASRWRKPLLATPTPPRDTALPAIR